LLRPKKVGTLPVGLGSDEVKQTNEIKYAPILLNDIGIENIDITADALHTQSDFAHYLVEQKKHITIFVLKEISPHCSRILNVILQRI
jgi:predicted transposase YbfD/YdcC